MIRLAQEMSGAAMVSKAIRKFVVSSEHPKRKGKSTKAKPRKPKDISQEDWDSVDSPPLSDEMLAAMRPAREVFPELVAEYNRTRGQRGRQKKPCKVVISLRVEPDTVAAYKAGGRGYQTRMAAVLKKHAK
jgi:uncharacterized protein (DUF4415 family)